LFVLVVPQVVAGYNALAKLLVKWEDHPTPVGAEESLTGKTLWVHAVRMDSADLDSAMNGIVAYLGLFLSA